MASLSQDRKSFDEVSYGSSQIADERSALILIAVEAINLAAKTRDTSTAIENLLKEVERRALGEPLSVSPRGIMSLGGAA